MKKTLKQISAIAALCMMPIALNAQIQTDFCFEENFGVTPKVFCYNGNIFMTVNNYEDGTIDVYNGNFEKTKTLITGTTNFEDVISMEFYDYDTGSSLADQSFLLTQTLFNTDEKFEYIRSIRENSKTVGFRIMSEDGSEIQSISFNTQHDYVPDLYLMRINGVLFLTFWFWSEGNNFAVYKIDQQGLSVKPMAQIPVNSVGHYSMDGRRQARMQRGVNILRESDGTTKKVLVK